MLQDLQGVFPQADREVFFGEALSQVTTYDIECYRQLRKKAPITVTRKKGDALIVADIGKVRSHASVNRELACLSHLFSMAVEWGLVDKSPFRKMKGDLF